MVLHGIDRPLKISIAAIDFLPHITLVVRRLVRPEHVVLRVLYFSSWFLIPVFRLFVNGVVIALNIYFLSRPEFMNDNDKGKLIGWAMWQFVSIAGLLVAQGNSAIIFYKLDCGEKKMDKGVEKKENKEIKLENGEN
jgi:hypothetical protein